MMKYTLQISDRKQQDVVGFARGKIGSKYAYTLDNKSCGNHDYNCSQLLYCAYAIGAWIYVDAFVTPSDIYHSDYVFYIKTVK